MARRKREEEFRRFEPGSMCRPGKAKLDGPVRDAVETGRNRLVVTAAMFLLAFALIGLRLVDVTVMKAGEHAQAQHGKQKPKPSALSSLISPANAAIPDADAAEPAAEKKKEAARQPRADIIDRNGVVLASSITTYSLFADPKLMLDKKDAAKKLIRMFPELREAELAEKFKTEKRFVWVRRHMTPRQYQQVMAMGVPGLAVRKDMRRVYPHGRLFAHILGYTDVDDNGLAGIEQKFNVRLNTTQDKVRLSLDMRVQHILREELAAAVKTYRAIGASGIVLDARTGEIVAMVSLPDFDPNNANNAPDAAKFNRNTLGVYEMGSTFKIFNTAMSLDSGMIKLGDSFDARAPLQISRFTIRDYHPQGKVMSVAEIFQHSSNIGSAKMAMKIGGVTQRAYLDRLGLIYAPKLEIPELSAPLVPKQWREINTATIAYGHGISVTPIQMVSAVAAVSNDGVYVSPTLLRRDPKQTINGTRVISSKTSEQMRDLMRLVVEKGTGRKAEVEGYLVGGKTGSADKPGKHGYRGNGLIASFVGIYPYNQPRYVVVAMIDEPKGTKETGGVATGGLVAAPVVQKIIARSAPLLGVKPQITPAPEKAKPGVAQKSATPPAKKPATAQKDVGPPIPLVSQTSSLREKKLATQ